MPAHGVLVRFGELGIKSTPVRRRMMERLRANLDDALLRAGVEGGAARSGSRLWLAGPDPDRLADAARRVFGVVSVSPARVVAADLDEIGAAAVETALARPWQSFAIRARREGTHPFRSQDVAVQVGSRVFLAAEAAGRTPRVDLGTPDLELHVEVRAERAYLFTDVLPGPGGLPVGSQGRVVALLSDTASFLAAWLMMRRGCEVVPLHAGDAGSVPVQGIDALARWGLPRDVELLPVGSGAVAKPVLLAAAAEVARRRRAVALVTGETLASRLAPGPADVPVLRPVCGLDPEEAARWQAFAGVPDLDAPALLDDAADETAESLLRQRRTVSA